MWIDGKKVVEIEEEDEFRHDARLYENDRKQRSKMYAAVFEPGREALMMVPKVPPKEPKKARKERSSGTRRGYI